MAYSLFVGVVLGALTVVFALQNAAVVTVTFFSWQLAIPLALALLSALALGIVAALLILLPNVIRDEIYLAALKREKQELEQAALKDRAVVAPAH